MEERERGELEQLMCYAQGRRRHRLHDDDLSDPEYEYTHTHVIMTEGILKYLLKIL